MIDRIFSAALTFCLLIGGTLAIGSAMFGTERNALAPHTAAALVKLVQLERVVVVGKRLAPASAVATSEANEPATHRVQ